MRKLDLISQSPNNFNIQKDSNKTTFGGIISIIYIIFALLIFLLYFTRFLLNEPYEIISFISEEKRINTRELIRKFSQSEKYNPPLNLSFSLRDFYYNNLSDRFVIYDYLRNIYIERDKIIQRRANDLHFAILYKCISQTNCSILEEDISTLYLLTIQYDDFIIDPQSDIPIKIDDYYMNVEPYVFNSQIELRALLRWNIIRYEDTKGLLDIFEKNEEDDRIKEKDIYIGGYYQRYDTNIINNEAKDIPRVRSDTKLLLLIDTIGLTISREFLYEDYKRKKNSILDSLANIFSLWISSYNLICFLFSKLYSKSFDKYKIIDNILSKQKINLPFNNYYTNKVKDKEYKDNLEEKNSNPKIELKENFIENEEHNNANDDFINKINDGKMVKKEGKKERMLPKRTFLDFIFNTIYIEKCCHSKRQKILVDCNNIILKYYSLENILYNQFMFENLIKDYSWNNPELQNILNNDSFLTIKNDIKII